MAIRFNADEILQVAERIEQNAARFYRTLRDRYPQLDATVLNNLAAMEEDHLRTFSSMREKLTAEEKQPTVYDPMDEGAQYLRAMADLHGGEGDPSLIAKFTGNETLEQLLLKAIELEKVSILFYMAMLPLVPPDLGKSAVERVIAEEKNHVVTLSRFLNEVRKK